MIEMIIPSSLHQTLAPKEAHVILCNIFLYECDQKEVGKMKQDFVNAVISSIEKYAPGFKDSILG